MYLLVIFLPLFSFVLSGLFGRFLGFGGTAILSISSLLKAFFLSLKSFNLVLIQGSVFNIKLTSWVTCEVLSVDWGFLFDSTSTFMCVIVTFISLLVHVYSIEYMSHDPHLPRFLSYLSLFTFFMLILVTSDNYVQLFLGWEGVGLASYLLINFWYTRIQANKAAIKAMVINRIGDFFLLIGIMLIFINFKSVDYASVAILTPMFKDTYVILFNSSFHLLSTISLFLFLGAAGKSAQLGLHTWLPDAMEGPTPVSALIHAATMVTAGVFLITRSSFIYENSKHTLEFISLLGALTSIFAASIGLAQNDIKKVVAYSTCSQLGYMVFACGLSAYSASFFHLLNHAFFKALLFLSAGSVIHSVNDEQDMRKLGGLGKILPLTYAMILVGSLALIGFPFLTGFYSKDLILEVSAGTYKPEGYFCYLLGSFGAFFTAFYSMRLSFLTFLSKPNGHKKSIINAHDSGVFISFSLIFLAVPSIVVGYLLKDLTVGSGSPVFGMSIFISIKNYNLYDAEYLGIFYKLAPVYLSITGFILALFLYAFHSFFLFKYKISKPGKKLYVFLNRKWFFDKIYSEYFSQAFFKFGFSTSYKFMDRGIFEMLGATGLSTSLNNISLTFHVFQRGHIYHNLLSVLIGSATLLLIRQLWLFTGYMEWFHLFLPLTVIFLIKYFNNDVKANVTQLARVLGCGPRSRRFEPCHSPPKQLKGLKALNGFLNIKIFVDV
jgi:NADH-ubiquinone oxidoreductase chain 5